MAPSNGKRKHVQIIDKEHHDSPVNPKKPKQTSQASNHKKTGDTIQIVTGDYEKVLHGLAATLPPDDDTTSEISWSETFLFSAHTASIRCLAISPVAENGKRFLATGSADERINVYSIASIPPRTSTAAGRPHLNGTTIAENAGNRSLGSLNHHDRAITRLHFSSKAKLFSAAEDNTVAISRTRDWTMLSSIKAPIPKVHGRPSGDTAAPGEVPTGVNDFAIHPSQKLMLSVSRGERCMRLWNLMTGKKAGVLTFDRDVLAQAGETKSGSGDARRVLWDTTGERYIVGFERGAVLYGLDSKPQAVLRPPTPTKLHQYHALTILRDGEDVQILAISTEDGRILFFELDSAVEQTSGLPRLECVAQIGGRSNGVSTRLKDFQILRLKPEDSALVVVGAGSDGTIWLWQVESNEISSKSSDQSVKQVGRLLGRHKTESRITCLDAFLMDGKSGSTQLEEPEQQAENDSLSSSEEDE